MAYLVRIVNPITGLAVAVNHPFNTVTSPFSGDVPLTQIGWGAEGAFNMVTATTGLPVDLVVRLGATLDSITAKLATDKLQNGLTEVTPAFAAIAASSTDNTLLAAQGSGNKIRVHSLTIVAASAVTARFESGTGGTALTGQMPLAANGGVVLGFNPVGWFETAANALLNLELGSAVSVAGCFQYTVVT